MSKYDEAVLQKALKLIVEQKKQLDEMVSQIQAAIDGPFDEDETIDEDDALYAFILAYTQTLGTAASNLQAAYGRAVRMTKIKD